MRKKYIRYFAGLIDIQQKWLNTMATKSYRLIQTDKPVFEFEECKPNTYASCVDFVAHITTAQNVCLAHHVHAICAPSTDHTPQWHPNPIPTGGIPHTGLPTTLVKIAKTSGLG